MTASSQRLGSVSTLLLKGSYFLQCLETRKTLNVQQKFGCKKERERSKTNPRKKERNGVEAKRKAEEREVRAENQLGGNPSKKKALYWPGRRETNQR